MRLINADALKEYIDAQKGRPFIGCTVGEAFKIMTDEQPTVDAVPVVRCKDCKWWPGRIMYADTYLWKYSWCERFKGNEFCSKAERKEE